MDNNDLLVLNELSEHSRNLKPSIQIEQALDDVKSTFQTSVLAEIPFAEITALGGAFSSVAQTITSSASTGLYRCVFPQGVTGTLAMAKDGSGALGTILNNGIVGQARWIPVDKALGPAPLTATLVAIAVLAVAKQIQDIKDGQTEIISILERDKKSQLLADYDLLVSYIDDYRFYWENDASLVVNLNQVKNIKRNAMKDIRSYSEQLEEAATAKKNILKLKSASQSIGHILNRFIHYKLALHVFVLSEYMEVMLSKNFQAEYLNKIAQEIKEKAFDFRTLYTACYDKIEFLKKEAITTQAASRFAEASRTVGSFIGKIPIVKDGPVDEFLIGFGDSISEAERRQLDKTLAFFIQHKDSGLMPVADHIDTINLLANKPVVMVFDDKIVRFHELSEAV